MMFRKLKRVWSHNDMNYIKGFKEKFPELDKISREELCDRWASLGIDLYTQKKQKTNSLIRLTLPFALVLIIIMFFGLPFAFLLRGEWNYGKPGFVYNWLKSLKIFYE